MSASSPSSDVGRVIGGSWPSRRGRSAVCTIAAATVVLPVLLVACAAPAAQAPAPPPAALSDVADVSSAPVSDPAAASVASSAAPRGTLVVHGTGDVNLDLSLIHI